MMLTKTLNPYIVEAIRARGNPDAEINGMSMLEVMREYAGWELGDPSWGTDFHRIVRAFDKEAPAHDR